MTRLLSLIIISLSSVFGLAAQSFAPAQVPNVHLSDRSQYLSDPQHILSAATTDSINALFATVWAETTAEPVAAIIPSMEPGYNIDEFTTALFELWGIGKKDKDNGVLVVVAVDDRRMAIRTGYGVEGVLTDGTCGAIRDAAISYFRQGDYSGGLLTASRLISEILLDPAAREEILSAYANDAGAESDSAAEMLAFMFWAGVVALVSMLAWIALITVQTRHGGEQERYRRLFTVRPVSLFLSFVGLGVPIIAFLLCSMMMRHIRNHRRRCPNCQASMHKLDEVHDNDYLTPAQDLEERLNSIDYDVWLCDNCGETDITPYVNRQSSYTICPTCGARTLAMTGNRILAQPTRTREGRGERIYSCRNCHHTHSKPYTIAKTAAPVVIIPGGGGGSGFGGGGGFGGGSFGGGLTGGGGASGGW